ncbi:MAG: GtrA family protein [Hyphomicrobiales bacterium]|nr:GtrA family protein [Hyphomicrobiales bacterium]
MSAGNKLRNLSPSWVNHPARQTLAFGGAGVAAAIVHYGTLIGLVQGGILAPVPATLCGYLGGGLVSYALNRRHTYRSDRPHREAVWRFVVVAAVGFFLTWAIMGVLVDRWTVPYLPAQFLTTGIVLIWSFLAHRGWTFRQRAEGSATEAARSSPDFSVKADRGKRSPSD